MTALSLPTREDAEERLKAIRTRLQQSVAVFPDRIAVVDGLLDEIARPEQQAQTPSEPLPDPRPSDQEIRAAFETIVSRSHAAGGAEARQRRSA